MLICIICFLLWGATIAYIVTREILDRHKGPSPDCECGHRWCYHYLETLTCNVKKCSCVHYDAKKVDYQ